jgi:monofunctional glycosyltransferase
MRILWRIIKWACLLLAIYELWIFAQVIWWRNHNPTTTRFMTLQSAQLRSKNPNAKIQHTWVPYAQISIHLKRAVIAAEDAKFLHHRGFDWEGIENAMEKNLRRGQLKTGGSTISQQLAKNLFLSPDKNIFRKIQEAIITLMIEATWNKKRILEVYLNVVEWGRGVFGAQAAAKHHFSLQAQQINAYQAAQMAVLLPNPRNFEKSLPKYAQRYANQVLKRMPQTKVP